MSIAEKLQTIAENEQRVYDAGKQAEYIRYWETYLSKADDGAYAFAGSGWDDETFNPPRGTVLRPTNAVGMFCGTRITDLASLCEEKEITLDFSQSTALVNLFYAHGNTSITRVGVIDASSATSALQYTFRNQSKLHTIDKLILKTDGSQTFVDTFRSCAALVNIVVEGTIGQNDFNVSACPLSHDSLMSIINALKSGASNSVTLGATNLAKLTDAEKAIATQKGWTLL